MECKLSKEQGAKLVEYISKPGHYYLHGVFVPVGMSLLESISLGTNAQYILNIFPQNDEEEAAITNAFNNGDMFKITYQVDRFKIKVEPFLMRRSRDSQFGKKGEIIMDGIKPRIYDYINITSWVLVDQVTKKPILDKDGQVQPKLSENALKARALSIKNFRIKNGDYEDYATYLAKNGAIADEEPSDVTNTEEENKIQEEVATKAKEAEEKRKQLEAQLAALNAPEKF